MNITTQQARLRFTTIPSRLQDAMFSEQTDEIMDGIAQQYYLEDEKAEIVGKISGWVLLGFVHPEDVSREIQEQLGVAPQVAAEISKSLDTKIFNALRDDLSQAYAPAAPSGEEEAVGAAAVGVGIAVGSAAAAGPKIISENFEAKPNVALKSPVPMPPKPAAPNLNVPPERRSMPAAPAPQPMKQPADKGWSKQASQDPVVKLGILTPSTSKPTGTAQPVKAPATTAAAAAPAPVPKGMSEFERLDLAKKNQAPSPSMPAPVMLHEVSPSTPLQTSSSFQIVGGMQNQIQKTAAPISQSVKPAVIEFGGAAAPKAPAAPAMKPVIPTAPTGPRQITEFTAQPTKPPSPQPAPPPLPPKPPTQQGSQVIVKNFLGPQK